MILPVRERNKKKITAKNDNFTFVGTFTKAKDLDASTTILFTGTGQLSHHKKNIVLYDGGWKNGEKHGKGIENNYNRDSSSDKRYIGNFRNGYRSGQGKVYRLQNNELFYEGTFKNGRIIRGQKYRNGQTVYIGSFSNNRYFK